MAERARVQPIAPPKKTGLEKILDTVERVGNKVPHPAVIFILLIAAVIILSHILYLLGFSATYETINPDTHQTEQITTKAQSLLTADGIRFLYAEVVRNFMSFNAVGVIIVAMLGVGVAETSGLIKALIRKLVQVAPPAALTYILVFVGIVSSIAADAGYLVLIPLAAAAFLSVGRNPLVGLAASFAGVSAVFSVNILIKPLDGILTGITNDAIHLMNPNLSVSLTANFWFSVASVLMLTVVCGLITDKLIEPRLGPYRPPKDVQAEEGETAPANEPRGLKFATWGLIAILALLRSSHDSALGAVTESDDWRSDRRLSLHERADRFHRARVPGSGRCLWLRRENNEGKRRRHQGNGESGHRTGRADVPAVFYQPVHRPFHVHQFGDDLSRKSR